MKKIVTVFDITDAPWRVLNFACKLAKQHSVLLHGIYLSEPTGDTEFTYIFPNDLSLTKDKQTNEEIDSENQSLIKDNVKLFRDECERVGIEYKVDAGANMKQVETESASAEVVLADVNGEFIKKLIKHSKAPVCLVGGSDVPEKVVLPHGYPKEEFERVFPEFVGL